MRFNVGSNILKEGVLSVGKALPVRSAMPVLQRWEAMFRERDRGSVIREKGGAWKHDRELYEKYFA